MAITAKSAECPKCGTLVSPIYIHKRSDETMYLLTHVYYWCSDGCPDAVPAGILAFNLGMNEASHNDDEINEIFECACNFGFFDDVPEQLGFLGYDADLIIRESGCLTANQICTDWQWQLIKQQPGLNYVEHDLDATLEAFIAEQEGS